MAGESRKKKDTTKQTRKQEPAKAKTGTTVKRSRARNAQETGKGAKKRAIEPDIEENSFIGTEVAIIASFAVSVLLFLSNFGLCGKVGTILRGVQLGIFGSIGYIAPVLFFVGICFYLSNMGNIRAVFKMASVLVVLLALCGLAQMIFGGQFKPEQKLLEYYKLSGATGDGGGLMGGLLVMLLCSTVGTIGAYLVLLALLIVGSVCITEKSLVDFVKKGSGRAYQYAREDIDRRKEIHEERREEKRRLREEQRVRGVNFGVTTLTEGTVMKGFAAEMPGDLSQSGDGGHFEDPIPFESEASYSQGQAKEPPVNPADVFRGRIDMPSLEETEERILSVAEKKAVEKEEDSGNVKGVETFSGGSAYENDELLKSIYVKRDTRTLEELTMEDQAARKILTDVIPIQEAARIRRENRQSPAVIQSQEEAEAVKRFEPGADEEEISFGNSDIIAGAPEEPELEAEPDSMIQPWNPSGSDGFDEADYIYSGAQDENCDDFYTPEEPKRVVTASGKVIEVDTEQVKKTLEKKREEKKELPDGEMDVNELIGKKTEAVKAVKKEYRFPSLDLLKKGAKNPAGFSEKEYRETAIKLQQTLQNFGVGVTVTNISCGPSVTRYELHPEQGVKVSKIVALSDDIKLNLAAADIRIEAPIPGKAAVGIEVPNKENTMVFLRDLLESEEFKRHPSKVAFAVGKDIAGQAVVTDIAKMPHLLIAGATGSGKSVCINTLIMSIIYKADPEDVKLIMVDPKVVELSVYNGIPHLLIPVVTDPKKASGALNWAVAEMTDRYNKFAQYNVRDLKGYNDKIKNIEHIQDENKPEKLPQIIIIVDELADLMMVSPGEVEDSICRLAQLARAAGIHLVIATQRPSVNVITGLIKANVPSRIAFSVSSGVDSRTIIDMNGAEKLLGKGDMLFYPSGVQKPQRVQGAFVSDQEVSSVVEFLTEQGITAEYNPEIESKISSATQSMGSGGGNEQDAYFVQAGRFIIEKDKASIGMLQRMFKIGFNRAARIMDQLADAGVVGEEEGTKPRKVLMSIEQFENMLED